MKLIIYSIQETVYNRTPTCGGMDSEFSHTSVENTVVRVVVENEYPSTLAMADAFVKNYAGRATDQNFAILHRAIGVDITAILPSPSFRI